jgi:hypothetical protein
MSIGVELEELQEVCDARGRAPYLLTVSDDGRPHSVEISWGWSDSELDLRVGRSTLANACARPLVSLLWPADELGGYSLIVDGEVVGSEQSDTGGIVRVRPTRAVLHRPATGTTANGCSADCAPILRQS